MGPTLNNEIVFLWAETNSLINCINEEVPMLLTANYLLTETINIHFTQTSRQWFIICIFLVMMYISKSFSTEYLIS